MVEWIEQALAAVQEAKACFDTFNVDLMYALPEQSLDELAAFVLGESGRLGPLLLRGA